MSTELITAWYNEEFLAPFFLRHYSWVDRIIILLDYATDDNTFEIASGYKNVTIYPIIYHNGMDDKYKIDTINEIYKMIKSDYVIIADADEFIDAGREQIKSGYDLARVKFYNVYRHETDADLDPMLPVIPQRRHGVYVWPYTKPCVARAGLRLSWGMGCHMIKLNGKREGNIRISLDSQAHYNPVILQGAHWINSDPCFCIKRRLGTMERQGERNLARNLSKHNHNLSEVQLMNELLKHRNDQVVL
jgi:hypothetical protein